MTTTTNTNAPEAITPEALLAAAAAFAARTDKFAAGKAATCADLAAKLRRYGRFASEAQEGYARKLIQWAVPREREARPTVALPAVRALVIDRGLSLHLGCCKVVKFRGGAVGVVSTKFGLATYGVIDAAGSFERFAACTDLIAETLLDVEARGIEAVADIGRATGRCCVCARELTDAASIEAGIGPVCAAKF